MAVLSSPRLSFMTVDRGTTPGNFFDVMQIYVGELLARVYKITGTTELIKIRCIPGDLALESVSPNAKSDVPECFYCCNTRQSTCRK